MRALLAAFALLVAAPVSAQLANPSSVTPSDLAAVQAAMPTPATAPPPPDTLSGSAGAVPTVYALGTHTHPRVTWSPVATTNASGVFTVSFPAGFFASPPTISLSWESAVNISCQMTLVTATALTGRCNLLAGLLPTGAGVIVHVVALPRNSNP